MIDGVQPWPSHLVDADTARSLLRLIRRNEGAAMPGLLAMPRCEVLIPAHQPGAYHRMQLVLDGDFVRVYPDGNSKPGVLYPVSDPHLLRTLVDKLPIYGMRVSYGEEAQRTPMV
jgi:hypothetical protein